MASKTKLILLHGALGSKAQLQTLSNSLQQHFQIFSFNFSGHGGEPLPPDFSIRKFSRELSDFIEAHNLAPAHIFGYSMGGYVALSLALSEPEKLASIMTLGTKFHWTPEAAHQEASQFNPLKIESKVPQFAEQLRQRHAPQNWRELLSKTSAMMLELGKNEAISLEKFEDIKCPVLIALGEEDRMVSQAESEAVCKRLARGRMAILPNSPHPIEQVNTEQLAGRIREYFPG